MSWVQLSALLPGSFFGVGTRSALIPGAFLLDQTEVVGVDEVKIAMGVGLGEVLVGRGHESLDFLKPQVF